ncbi:hypothetical protein KGF56_001177 [Candida oxycetoniae]|uniref:Large ribosomal subunit protein bL32m n=1 Tax=Candida oxycetoniae TaxID=497107 RepID=A0AAI9SZD6_9ASCO|nr:uncharacterized protein KGF56_001177 [Candida oxycetoniae]KAI3405958.1 hypothetical protein KGF56_001177 [Candida oxycetoniae]
MSLALRFGLITSLHEAVFGALPKVPSITIRLGLSLPKPCQEHNHTHHGDSRLSELQEQLENGLLSPPPFMIDNGTILRAAPKKKSSYMRKRMKLYMPGNKQIKPLHNIVRCPACGSVKRSHFMCMSCFAEIKTFLKKLKRQDGLIKDPVDPQRDLNPVDERIVYPNKFLRVDERRLKKKDWIPKREEPLLFSKDQMIPQKRKKYF